MSTVENQVNKWPWLGWVLFALTALIVIGLGIFLSTIMERRAEAVVAYRPIVEHGQFEADNAVWGKNFPKEYESYMKTADTTFRSKYNGAGKIDMLAEDPRLVVLWAGYGFSKDYNQGRGHYYAVKDIQNTLRTGAPTDGAKSPMPNTCWTCKSPDVPRLMDKLGPAEFYKGTWETRGPDVVNHIGCADCHEAKTMQLRISRPALKEAFARQGKNIEDASHQEMRSLVCAQCHVEYYFDKKMYEGSPYLVFPWDKGMSMEKMEEYYDEKEFADWTHALSKAPMLKAQHPDYEIYQTGTHASRGVACADCHMPYKTEGGQKFTDHHIQSPLNNIERSCMVCHREDTERLVQDVYERQDKVIEFRNELEKLLVRAHLEAKKAWDLGANEEQMKGILDLIRKAQWRWDYAAAGHGSSFHSSTETSRVISSGLVKAQEARVELSRLLASLGFNEELPYPDIDNKEKAQALIGLPVEKLKSEKKKFLEKEVKEWMANYSQK